MSWFRVLMPKSLSTSKKKVSRVAFLYRHSVSISWYLPFLSESRDHHLLFLGQEVRPWGVRRPCIPFLDAYAGFPVADFDIVFVSDVLGVMSLAVMCALL